MRPIRIVGPVSGTPIPVDIYTANPAFYVTMSGSGTLRITNDDPFSSEALTWTTVSPGSILYPVRAFTGAQAAETTVLTITQQGWI